MPSEFQTVRLFVPVGSRGAGVWTEAVEGALHSGQPYGHLSDVAPV